ncbi:MAG TPA: ClpXP protease specificity-enhancing factor SspB [Methylocystis sp.]|nr:ClpXP protease specificity-enhancing factor SspB [Methylocystis sp.]
MVDLIRYDLLVQEAMRSVVRRVMGEVAETGQLPGEHHFTITFRTDAPGVRISRRLAEQWPYELTIILQYQFSDLMVDDLGFSVKLQFRGVSETLYVPFEAVTVFSDPTGSFGVKFNVDDEHDASAPAPQPRRGGPVKAVGDKSASPAPPAPEPKPAPPARAEAGSEGGDKIVSIDAFRKKH